MAIQVSTGADWTAGHRATAFSSSAESLVLGSAAAAPLSSSREHPVCGPSALRIASPAAPFRSAPTTTQAKSSLLVPATSVRASPAPLSYPSASPARAAHNLQTATLPEIRSRIPGPSYTTSSLLGSESIGQFSGSAPTSPIFPSQPSGSIHHGPYAGCVKWVASPGAEQIEIIKGEEVKEVRPDPLGMTLREFHLQFRQTLDRVVSMIPLRPMLAFLKELGFRFDEFLPSADRRDQRALSSME
jgi:hypothetical protein